MEPPIVVPICKMMQITSDNRAIHLYSHFLRLYKAESTVQKTSVNKPLDNKPNHLIRPKIKNGWPDVVLLTDVYCTDSQTNTEFN